MTDVEKILNFVQLTPDIGTAGQPTAKQLAYVAEAGYQAVINLALPTSENALVDEGSISTGLGMSYFHMPIDFAAPTVAEAARFIGLMKVWDGQRVFVHCAMNLRVSAFMYLYLKHACGFEEGRASSPILSKWEPRMSDVWRSFMKLTAADVLG